MPWASAKAQWTPRAQQTAAGPTARTLLDDYVREGLRANLSLSGARSAARRAAASVHEARGRLLPTVGANARYSQYSGIVNIGEFINPA